MMHRNTVIDKPGKYEGERLLVKLLVERKNYIKLGSLKGTEFRHYCGGSWRGSVFVRVDSLGCYEVDRHELPSAFEASGDLPEGDPESDGESQESGDGVCEHDVDGHCCQCADCEYTFDENGHRLWDEYGDPVLRCQL